ncbi:histidine kinase OS=Streptomyces tendae OX=1932 GN=GUR47_34610 PE=4 SV=1 [Streptomyces tendae]
MKFTPPEETVRVEVASAGDTATVVVTDNGPGLTDEELTRVGDRFWRSGRHQNVNGSGLGLSICRALLAAGDGAISFGHHDPHGLQVTVTVPRTGTAPQEPEPPYGLTER